MPRFSVVIPVYKTQAWLSECLDSLLTQDFGDWEAIVVIDASPDACTEIARDYEARDARFCVLELPENKGTHVARKCGVAQAQGDYVCFLDPDDSFEAGFFSALERYLSVNDVDSVHVATRVVYERPEDAKRCQEYERFLCTDMPLLGGREAFKRVFIDLDNQRDWKITQRVFRRTVVQGAFSRSCDEHLTLAEDMYECFLVLYDLTSEGSCHDAKLTYHDSRGICTKNKSERATVVAAARKYQDVINATEIELCDRSDVELYMAFAGMRRYLLMEFSDWLLRCLEPKDILEGANPAAEIMGAAGIAMELARLARDEAYRVFVSGEEHRDVTLAKSWAERAHELAEEAYAARQCDTAEQQADESQDIIPSTHGIAYRLSQRLLLEDYETYIEAADLHIHEVEAGVIPEWQCPTTTTEQPSDDTHYRVALIAHVVCEQNNPAWQCYETLKLAGHTVEVIDPRVVQGVLDENGSVTPGVLDRFIEVFQPDYVACRGESAQEILSACREQASGYSGRSVRIVVCGYLGCNNFGDELIFSQIQSKIYARYAHAVVSVIGYNPRESLIRHGVSGYTFSQKTEICSLLNGADALVFMGGILIDCYLCIYTAGPAELAFDPGFNISGQTFFTLMANLFDTPVIYLGVGAGPLANPDACALVRLSSLTGARFIGRDQETCRLLQQAGISKNLLMCKADLAFALQTSPDPARLGRFDISGDYVVISLRDYPGVPDSLIEVVAFGCDYLWSSYHLRPVLLDISPEDTEIHDRLLAHMSCSQEARHIRATIDIDDIVQILAASRLVVAMRLHASLVANIYGVPSIGFDYENKIGAYYRRMGRQDDLLPLTVKTWDLYLHIERLIGRYEEEVANLQKTVSVNRMLALEAFDELWRVLDSGNPEARSQYVYPRIISRTSEQLLEARSRVSLLETELSAAQAEVTAVRASHSYRVGHVLLRPLSALKRLMRKLKR